MCLVAIILYSLWFIKTKVLFHKQIIDMMQTLEIIRIWLARYNIMQYDYMSKRLINVSRQYIQSQDQRSHISIIKGNQLWIQGIGRRNCRGQVVVMTCLFMYRGIIQHRGILKNHTKDTTNITLLLTLTNLIKFQRYNSHISYINLISHS